MNEFEKRMGKGLVMVGEPHECGWYAEGDYVDPDDYYVVDTEVVIPQEKILKVLAEAAKEFPFRGFKVYNTLIFEERALKWFDKWFGEKK